MRSLWIFSSIWIKLTRTTLCFFYSDMFYKCLHHVDTYTREVCVKHMRQHTLTFLVTHNLLLMVSVRYDSHYCCFQFSFLYLQGYLTINHNSLGFESGLLIFCSCSRSVFFFGPTNTSGATH